MKIYDCFLYSGERALLEARLRYYREYCSNFIIVESTHTFTGTPRQVDFDLIQKTNHEYGEQVRWKVIDETPSANPWVNEFRQRDFIKSQIYDIESGDIFMLSDCDEFVEIDFIEKLNNLPLGKIRLAKMSLLRYEPHFEHHEKIHGTAALKYKGGELNVSALRKRAIEFWKVGEDLEIVESGYHFSYFLGEREIVDKIRSFSHSELNIWPYNQSYFWFLMKIMGLDINGKTVLHIVQNEMAIELGLMCNRKHRMNKIRLISARTVGILINIIFKFQVKKIRSFSDSI